MTAFTPYPGCTLLVPSGPTGLHLFIVVTKPCKDGMHLLLSLASIKPKIFYDPTCVFAGGEHEFIKRPSYVFYRSPQQRKIGAIQKSVASKLFVPKTDLDAVLFQSVCAGIEKSKFSPPWAIEYFRTNKP